MKKKNPMIFCDSRVDRHWYWWKFRLYLAWSRALGSPRVKIGFTSSRVNRETLMERDLGFEPGQGLGIWVVKSTATTHFLPVSCQVLTCSSGAHSPIKSADAPSHRTCYLSMLVRDRNIDHALSAVRKRLPFTRFAFAVLRDCSAVCSRFCRAYCKTTQHDPPLSPPPPHAPNIVAGTGKRMYYWTIIGATIYTRSKISEFCSYSELAFESPGIEILSFALSQWLSAPLIGPNLGWCWGREARGGDSSLCWVGRLSPWMWRRHSHLHVSVADSSITLMDGKQ